MTESFNRFSFCSSGTCEAILEGSEGTVGVVGSRLDGQSYEPGVMASVTIKADLLHSFAACQLDGLPVELSSVLSATDGDPSDRLTLAGGVFEYDNDLVAPHEAAIVLSGVAHSMSVNRDV